MDKERQYYVLEINAAEGRLSTIRFNKNGGMSLTMDEIREFIKLSEEKPCQSTSTNA